MKYILLLQTLLFAAVCFAQNPCKINVTGHVIDEHNNQPLVFADVFIIQQTTGTTTDENGGFKLTNVCEGSIQLRLSHVGCATDTVSIIIGGDTHLHLNLEHHLELLELVEIEAEKPHQDIAAAEVLAIKQLSKSDGRSLAAMLENIEGVQSLNTGGNISKPVIHGLHSNRLVIVNQGTRIEGQQWGGEHAPEIDPLTADELEVVSGASALRYGPEALAGAIIARSTKLDTLKGTQGWLQLAGATNGQKGLLAAKLQGQLLDSVPLFYSLQGSLGRSGDLSAPNYVLRNTGSFNRNMDARIAFIKPRYGAELHYGQINSDLGILSYSHIGNLTDLQNALNSEIPVNASDSFSYAISRPKQHVVHELTSAQFWFKPNLAGKLNLNLSRQYNLRQEFDKTIFIQDENAADLQYEITTYQADLLYEQRFSPAYKLEVGTSFQTQANTYYGRFFIPNFRNYQGGIFAINHYQLGKFEFEAGARYDKRWQQAFMYRNEVLFAPNRQFEGLSFNAGMMYAAKKMRVLLNLGQAWRPPSINELYSGGLHHGAAAVEFGNQDLQEERAQTATLKLQFRDFKISGKPLQMSVSTYAYRFDQFIYLVPKKPATLTIRGAFPTFEYQAIDALFRGVDFSIRYDVKRFQIALRGEMLRASELKTNNWLLNIPNDQFDVNVAYQLSAKNWSPTISLSSVLARTQSRFPAGVDYANPPAGYVLLNSEISGVLPFKNNNISYSFRVENMLNQAYRNYLNRLRYFANEPGRSFILSIRIPFKHLKNKTL